MRVGVGMGWGGGVGGGGPQNRNCRYVLCYRRRSSNSTYSTSTALQENRFRRRSEEIIRILGFLCKVSSFYPLEGLLTSCGKWKWNDAPLEERTRH